MPAKQNNKPTAKVSRTQEQESALKELFLDKSKDIY